MMTVHSLWKNWLTTQAFPLWSGPGFDTSRQLYQERLAFDHTPITLPALRLMVQARQIATFCQASCDGLYQQADQAHHCLERVEKLYYQPDGQAGWVFSIGPDQSPVNTTRDLYGHSFILFAYAWAYKHTPTPHYLQMARQTVHEVEQIFHTGNGGFLDSFPAVDAIRRQNPHMHLLEALLTLFEVSSDAFYYDKAQSLIDFSLRNFLSKDPTMLLEFFTEGWQPAYKRGENRVEAGHQFEWSWLLSEFNRLSPQHTHLNETAHHVASSLFKNGRQYGLKEGLVLDAMTETGTLTELSYRIWPQTELMRLLVRHANAPETERLALLNSLSERFFRQFAPRKLAGGWIDRFHENESPATDFMPASSLYHIYSAAREIMFHPFER
ncbi:MULTISPECIES: AGE family epimerase/isomerase [unclassified Saccharibacter]|uniref:AGE family epimerase/isomerase n=1 Tax=unclassified Saccharibacter TaxID=2648722 RepID=UPI001325C92E|nr:MULTISPECIES: AGE family epimerase/isomerase [unclassified Saccharibacter]MXV35257.1 mannose-6-phosphate isomerase [Saccharibacter sp. EH611]MXV57895.1 mannose-6-phosphate isomerase [Saccharibacter sp. EH70]MXV65191.1 mannose-6-phosphate isomerase [Saccharibacter sp. EH60]